MRCLALVLALFSLSGCYNPAQLPGLVDRWSFLRMGGTLFGHPEALTLKEIHLDTGTLTGREVIVEGEVTAVSEHGTYLVLKDDMARMLVVLTDMEAAAPLLTEAKPKILKVMGTVETGVKGLPYIRARSLNLTDELTPPVGSTSTSTSTSTSKS